MSVLLHRMKVTCITALSLVLPTEGSGFIAVINTSSDAYEGFWLIACNERENRCASVMLALQLAKYLSVGCCDTGSPTELFDGAVT